jgi:hypothetical protein
LHEIYHISELEKIYEKPRLTSWCTLSPSTMDVASRSRARGKLQDDAVAQTLLGKLCMQVPEVFTTHVMPHLKDKDLRSLALLGGEPRRVLRSSSRAVAVSSIYPCMCPSEYADLIGRFVGSDPDGSAYCKRCRSRHGTRHGSATLATLPDLHSHARRIAFNSTDCADRKAHSKMFDSLDEVLLRLSLQNSY